MARNKESLETRLVTWELQRLSGSRILSSFIVKAKDASDADKKSFIRRRAEGWIRYRIAKVTPGKFRLRHGGLHAKFV